MMKCLILRTWQNLINSENMAELDQLVAEEIINGLSLYPACLVYGNPSDDKKEGSAADD